MYRLERLWGCEVLTSELWWSHGLSLRLSLYIPRPWQHVRHTVSRLWPASGDSQCTLTWLNRICISKNLTLKAFCWSVRISFPFYIGILEFKNFWKISSVLHKRQAVRAKKMERKKCLTRRSRKAAQAQCWVNAWAAWPQGLWTNQRPGVTCMTNQRQEDSSWLGKANIFCQFHNWTQKVRKQITHNLS